MTADLTTRIRCADPEQRKPRRRDTRTRLGRMRSVGDAVSCLESTLPSRARLVVLTLALVAFEREDADLARLARYTSMTRRTVRKYLRLLEGACGAEPRAFVRSVVDGARPVADWFCALERNGGRHG